MLDKLEAQLNRWVEANVIDQQTAGRIREFELSPASTGQRWQVLLAIAFGAIMVAAGVLLFIAAHWEELSPGQRFTLVLTMVLGFHLAAGALMPRLRTLGLALHGIGTVSLGAGIALAGQIFNLQEHWPGGVLLWAIGAALSWGLLRDWVQATITALLVPAWIASEWTLRTERTSNGDLYLLQFLPLLAITYFGASREGEVSSFRRALTWAGGIALLPLVIVLVVDGRFSGYQSMALSSSLTAVGLVMAFVLPLLAAAALRGKGVVWNAGFAVWVILLGALDFSDMIQEIAIYGLCGIGSVGLVAWGVVERRRERINLGVAAFALTILFFYFSSVMDKLGRSAALIGFGLLFLLGGWKLEQLRRKLVARASGAAS